MLSQRPRTLPRQLGTSLVEVMVTVSILAFALLGIAGLQSKIGTAEMESYQRAQALVTLSQMTERLNANTANAAAYVTNLANPVGTGDAQPADCTGIAVGPNRDLCEWSNALKGAGETSGGASVGGMMGGRGCISGVAPNGALGTCTAGVYTVAVVWQGLSPTAAPAQSPTAAPALACGAGLYPPTDAYRRLVAATVSIPTTSCF